MERFVLDISKKYTGASHITAKLQTISSIVHLTYPGLWPAGIIVFLLNMLSDTAYKPDISITHVMSG